MSRAASAQSFVSIDPIVLKGGMDQITPSLSLGAGAVRHALNFECSVSGGYTRVAGYERFDGHPSPADTAEQGDHRYISVDSFQYLPAVGDAVSFSGGATAVIAFMQGARIVLAKVTGVLAVAETMTHTAGGETIGTVSSVYVSPASAEEDAQIRDAVASLYRADIFAVPGSGPVRGVVNFRDTVYAFRDNIFGTAIGIYKSSVAGWSPVTLYNTVSFTAGGATDPADGAVLTQGGVHATIKRVVRTSGEWASNSAAGQFIVTTPTGGNFSAGAATIGGVTVTLSGAQTALAMLPGGRFEFAQSNFAGQSSTVRLYGCDGVNKAFEFDGDVLVPISTGAPVDTPTHIAVHRKYLFLANGSSIMYSAAGLPYDWSNVGGAGEIAVGDVVTGMIEMPGGANYAGATNTLCVTTRNDTSILYGSAPVDWNMVSYNTGTGAVAYSLQNMAQTFGFDDRGASSIQAALQYGNFVQSTITSSVLPFINERIGGLVASLLCRRKSQYRLFFNDKSFLYITVVNGKLMGCMPGLYAHQVACTYEGKDSNGTDVMYFGGDDGFVYQMEKGTSFDGEPIQFYLATNYSNAKSPRTLKRYRKAAIEILADRGSYAAFDFTSVLGYDSAEYSQPKSAFYGQYTGQTRWDYFTWDNFFWDANRVEPVECPLDGTAENIAFLISGSSTFVPPFTINSILVHYSPRRMMR